MMPEYWTGISQPANGMILAPSATWRSNSGVRLNVSSATVLPLLDPFQNQFVQAHLDVDRVIPGQAAGAESRVRRLDCFQQSFKRKIPNRVGSDEPADFRNGHP